MLILTEYLFEGLKRFPSQNSEDNMFKTLLKPGIVGEQQLAPDLYHHIDIIPENTCAETSKNEMLHTLLFK